ncbi:MAG: hypothetical protein Q9212_006022 [Teloschistes hypoglaucus]
MAGNAAPPVAPTPAFLQGVAAPPTHTLPEIPVADVTDPTALAAAFQNDPRPYIAWMEAAEKGFNGWRSRAIEVEQRSVAAFNKQVADLQDTRQVQLEQARMIDRLEQELSQANHRIEALGRAVAAQNRTVASKKHPHPDRYDGNPDKLREFMTQLWLKLRVNEDWYPTPRSQVLYALRPFSRQGVHYYNTLPVDERGLDPEHRYLLSQPTIRFRWTPNRIERPTHGVS